MCVKRHPPFSVLLVKCHFCVGNVFAAEKAGYKREQVLSMKDGENKMPLHTAVQSGDVHVSSGHVPFHWVYLIRLAPLKD